MAFGLTPEGFVEKMLSDIKSDFETSFRGIFGESIPLESTSAFSQFIGLMSSRLAEVWAVAKASNASLDPENAEDAALDAVCAITGTRRKKATSSIATMTLTGTNGTTVPAGSVASVQTIGTRFDTTTDATLATLTAWVGTTGYVLGDRVTNGGNAWSCTVAGTSASSGGPTGTGPLVTDGGVTWRFIGVGVAAADAPAVAEATGPLPALTGTLVNIETPVAGWSGVNNLTDALAGTNRESDPELRVRREEELQGEGRSPIDSIRTRVLNDVAGVTSCYVFQNDTEATVDGMPPRSVEVLALGGADQDIADAVLANVACGMYTTGNQTSTVDDAENASQSFTVRWSRPTEKPIYVIAHVTKYVKEFPSDGATQIRDAILAFGSTYKPGKDAVSSGLVAPCFNVAGVLDVTALYIGLAPAPGSSTTIAIAVRELATFDSARISVVLSDGVP